MTASGTHLDLDGLPYRFTGINIYNANNASGCWYPMVSGSTLDDSLAAISPGGGPKVIRAWFFQALATNAGQRDWSGIDHTLSVAAARGVKVIVTLGNQWADCDGVDGGAGIYKNKAWYETGYKQPDPAGTMSYRDYVAEIVARYKDNPTILAWQLMNEAEDSDSQGGPCSVDAGTVLKGFAQDVSGLVKSIDSNHLVSLGTLGSGQCGAGSADEYRELHSIPTIDLCEYHDYGSPSIPMPGDIWNGLQNRIDQCAALGKPLFVGETGIPTSDVGGSTSDRAEAFRAKLAAQFAAGVVGELVWAWNKDGSSSTGYDIGPGDPVLPMLAAFQHASEPATTSASDLSRIQNFAISHDGTKLAMAATLGGIAGLYTADRDGSNVYLLAAERPGFYAIDHPDFSPDDQKIAFTAFGNLGGGDLFTVDSTGGGLVNLTQSPYDEESPRYSPNGSSIVVVSADAATNNVISELRTVDSLTGAETLILNLYPLGRGVSSPTYASDGQSILFSMTDGLGQWQIASIPANGGAVTPLTQFTNGLSGFGPDSSRAALNNGKIVFFASISGGRAIYTMDADGGNLALAFTDPYSVSDVHWTASGVFAYLSTSFDNQGAHPHLHVPPAPVSASLQPGGSISSAPGVTEIAPVAATITTPVAGTVSIGTAPTEQAPAGYTFLGQQVVISAPTATPADPLVFTFRVDATLLVAGGLDATTVQVFRNGVRLPDCDPLSTGASPDPCLASRVTLADGDAMLTTRTSHASTWTFGTGPFASVAPVFTSGHPPGSAVVGSAYGGFVFAATGSPAPVFAVSEGALPDGLSLLPTGVLSGTPSKAGVFSFKVSATNTAGSATAGPFTIVVTAPVNPVITTAALPSGVVGKAYTGTLTAVGGISPYKWTIDLGELPAGLTLNSTTGGVAGVPKAVGVFKVTFKVTDTSKPTKKTATKALSITVAAPLISVTPDVLAAGKVGVAYSVAVSASGGTGPYVFKVASGSLPVGLKLASTGVLSGKPTKAGTYTFAVAATDAYKSVGTRTYTQTITP